MMFSKSFGYALRSILYLSSLGEEERRVQLSEIASKLNIPRHFLGKVMIKLAKENIISSWKGPAGGFCLNDNTLHATLLAIASITGESEQFDSCVLRLKKCDSLHPCPLHSRAQQIRSGWFDLLSTTTIGELLKKGEPDFLTSITAA
jgi:Rrf2 family protein